MYEVPYIQSIEHHTMNQPHIPEKLMQIGAMRYDAIPNQIMKEVFGSFAPTTPHHTEVSM